MEPHATLTQAEQNVLSLATNGGVSYGDLTEKLSVSRSTVRDHVASIVGAGVPLDKRTEDNETIIYYRPDANEHPTNPSVPDGDLRSKAAVTREAKETVHELIQYLNRDLTTSPPQVANGGLTVTEGHEDMMVHRSDDHIGAKYTDEYGSNTFDAETGISRVRTVSEKTFDLKRRKEQAGVTFDTLHIAMGGDHVHGVGIHDDQPWETELSVPEQLSVAFDIYMEFFDRAVEEFDNVQVICQRGNHGELRGDGMGPDDNLDDALFMMLDKAVRDRPYDNITFIRSDGGYFTNFRMRVDADEDQQTADALDIPVEDLPAGMQSGHRAHLRHGQKSLFHIGTSSGKNRWRGWRRRHQFDIAYRGHYHEFRIENIDSTTVIMSGAIVPPSDFEEGLAEWSEPAATVHGVSDERPLTWMYPIDFEE